MERLQPKMAVDTVYTAAASAAAVLDARELRVHLFRLLRFETGLLRDGRVRTIAAAVAASFLQTAGLPDQGITAAQYRAHHNDIEALPGRALADKDVQAELKELSLASVKAATNWVVKVGVPSSSAYDKFVASLAALGEVAAVLFVAPADGAEFMPWTSPTVAAAAKARLRQLRNPDLLRALATWQEELSAEEKLEVTAPRLCALSVADALEALRGEPQVAAAADASAAEPLRPWRHSTRSTAPGEQLRLLRVALFSPPCCLHPRCTPLDCQYCS
jgi:hypothetical protein